MFFDAFETGRTNCLDVPLRFRASATAFFRNGNAGGGQGVLLSLGNTTTDTVRLGGTSKATILEPALHPFGE
jgi:hypothetical protein